jgi:diguanylate cyclase (GGDEF)-like protein/PAS domain S-box-containing protein
VQEKMLAALKEAKQGLEEKVDRRTQSLRETNTLLAQEISRREADESRLRLYHKVFESTDEAVVITDPQGTIIEVNAAYLRITGFSREDVIGKNSRINQSGRHDKAFYKAMWEQILATGNWAGEIWDRRRNGEIYPKWLNINSVRNEKSELVNYVGVFMDISPMKAAEEKLEMMAYFDPLTHCPNRALFRDRLAREVEVSHRRNKHFALLFIDLDHFKDVNDTLGHTAGDLLLVEIAQRIRGCIREEDTLARLGGDEFTIIIRETDGDSSVIRAAECIIQEVSRPVDIQGSTAKVGASIGIAVFPQNGADAETLTMNADSAMYHAKGAGRGRYHFFGEEIGKR